MSDPFTITLSCLWAVACGGIAWYSMYEMQQITYVTLADGRKQERSIPLMFKLLLPLAPKPDPVLQQEDIYKDEGENCQEHCISRL